MKIIKKRHYTGLIVIVTVFLLVIGGAFWWGHHQQYTDKTVTVGIVGNNKGIQAVWKQVAKTAKQRYGITVKTKVFTDYTQPKPARLI